MVEVSTTSGRFGIAVSLISIGGLLTLTVVGAVVGLPMIVVGIGVAIHAWWKDFDDEETDSEAEPA